MEVILKANQTININKTIDLYNEEIKSDIAALPFIKGIVSLISLTSGAIFIFACYVLLRAVKIYQKSFVLTITALILVGTIFGTFTVGYQFRAIKKVSRFEQINKTTLSEYYALCRPNINPNSKAC